MRSEREKMLAGELYDALDPDSSRRGIGLATCARSSMPRAKRIRKLRRRSARSSSAPADETVWMQPPFYCDYGSNIELGERVFFNFNCIVLDVCRVGSATIRCSDRRCRSTPRCIR